MDTIGLDLHERESQLCVLAGDGSWSLDLGPVLLGRIAEQTVKVYG